MVPSAPIAYLQKLPPDGCQLLADKGGAGSLPAPLLVCPRRSYPYWRRTFFIRTEAVGWSLKFITLFLIGQITVEWATQIAATSSWNTWSACL